MTAWSCKAEIEQESAVEVRAGQKGASSPFLRFSLSSALAMAEAGAGLSETVTETTVTVTTEPVRKAGGGAV